MYVVIKISPKAPWIYELLSSSVLSTILNELGALCLGKGGGGVLIPCMTVVVYGHRYSRPYNTGTEHVGCSPDQVAIACSKREAKRGVFGESHEG